MQNHFNHKHIQNRIHSLYICVKTLSLFAYRKGEREMEPFLQMKINFRWYKFNRFVKWKINQQIFTEYFTRKLVMKMDIGMRNIMETKCVHPHTDKFDWMKIGKQLNVLKFTMTLIAIIIIIHSGVEWRTKKKVNFYK